MHDVLATDTCLSVLDRLTPPKLARSLSRALARRWTERRRRGRSRPRLRSAPSYRNRPPSCGPREPGFLPGAHAGDLRATTPPLCRARAARLPTLRGIFPWLRETSLRNVSARPARRVRWAPGALPALAGRFPGAPFRTGHAPFVMHPALHDGSRREAGGPKPAGRVRHESDR